MKSGDVNRLGDSTSALLELLEVSLSLSVKFVGLRSDYVHLLVTKYLPLDSCLLVDKVEQL